MREQRSEERSASDDDRRDGPPTSDPPDGTALPTELCTGLLDAWNARPVDRVRVVRALTHCVLWLRARGVLPEHVLLAVKERLPVGSMRSAERRGFVAEREVLLRLVLAIYFGTSRDATHEEAAADSLVRLWPEVERRAARPHPARQSARMVSDSGGDVWRVYERPEQRAAPMAAPSLVFEREGCMRRRRAYPAHWRELPDAALVRLLECPEHS
ncbi:MAG TPA: hypothetical protein VFS08_20125 [Gemmatimonadaceae bacterium]|nr:hypothetical protein [Gemmatimonadaceae bacterium]